MLVEEAEEVEVRQLLEAQSHLWLLLDVEEEEEEEGLCETSTTHRLHRCR